MAQAIGNDEPLHPPDHIISDDLVKDFLSDGHLWGLVFHHSQGRCLAVEDHCVGAATATVLHDAHLVGHQSGWIMTMLDEKVDKVLPHPLLRRQGHKLSAQTVIDALHTVGPNIQFYVVCR